MFLLIDCDNFYVNCERVFRPDLKDKPLVVLSNNDGCVIARSNEAKALGIKMAEPFFKIKGLCNHHKVEVLSSNYTLYGDLSARVMSVIQDAWEETEIYSIDEAFLDISTLPLSKIEGFCHDLQRQILKSTGIPTSIGCGSTKTLAKTANLIAKKYLKAPVFLLKNNSAWLQELKVQDIWGVGQKWAQRLKNQGIQTAYDLAKSDARLIGRRHNIMLTRTIMELQGVACISLDAFKKRKSIVSSRSFGQTQDSHQALREAVSYHSKIAWTKLRGQGLKANRLGVFVLSNPFEKGAKPYSNSTNIELACATDDITVLTKYAQDCLREIYKEGVLYKKCGVLLEDFSDKREQQFDLFEEGDKRFSESKAIMKVMDNINHKYGKDTIHLAAEGVEKSWSMRATLKTKSYTTQWSDLVIAYAN
ncbi:MAG: Y-family DNA polymerase [Gammaproteobacteria bacterium]|nr:Y-family DNA polymerase [Gammaproteobacteria bacterium]